MATFSNTLKTGQRVTIEKTRDEVMEWLVNRISTEIGLPAAKIPRDVNLSRYGLDSVRAIEITSDMTDWLGIEVSATAMWDFHTVTELVDGVMNGKALTAAPKP